MIPHEKTLVKRLEDQPFALVGINSDNEERYRTRRVEMGVTWPSFFDGGATGGPIASQWGVSGWPTIYVLDHEGRIRFKDVRGEEMDHAVDRLLAEMNGTAPPPEPVVPPKPSAGGSVPAARLIPPSKGKPARGSVPAIRLIPPAKQKPDGTSVPAAKLIPPAKKKTKGELIPAAPIIPPAKKKPGQ